MKNSSCVEFTKCGNPKPPNFEIVRNWIIAAWSCIHVSKISSSVVAAGFSENYKDWHISNHDVYGDKFCAAWEMAALLENSVREFDSFDHEDEFVK